MSILDLFRFGGVLDGIGVHMCHVPTMTTLTVVMKTTNFCSVHVFFSTVITSFVLLLFLIVMLGGRRVRKLVCAILNIVCLKVKFNSLTFLHKKGRLLKVKDVAIAPKTFLVSFTLVNA